MHLYHVCDLSIIHICIYYAVGGRIPSNGIGGHLPPHLPPRGHLVRQALQVKSYERAEIIGKIKKIYIVLLHLPIYLSINISIFSIHLSIYVFIYVR